MIKLRIIWNRVLIYYSKYTRMNKIVTHFESLHDGDLTMIGLQPKMCPAGVWTEGWGHAIVYKGKHLKGAENKELAYKLSTVKTKEDADRLLLQDLEYVNLQIARKIKVDLNDNQFTALQSFYFNCGSSSTLTKMINANDPRLYKWWTTHYIIGGGRKLPGLVRRRKTEATLFTTGKLDFFLKS